MRTIKVVVKTGYAGCELWDTFEVEDYATEEEIEKLACEVKDELVEWVWYDIDE